MKVLDLEEIEGQFGLMLREKTNYNNYVLIRFQDLDSVLEYYKQFKEEAKNWS